MSARRISVVVPTRDRPAFLREALASIRALEGADYSFEILVGDNGGLPETKAVAAEFGATHIPVAEIGASAARNAALRAASGAYIAFLDDDDLWLPAHLRQQFEMLDANPELDAVLGQVIYADQTLTPFSVPVPVEAPGVGDDMLREMLSGWFPQIGTLVARARIRDLAGEFDPKLLGGQDLDWMLRIARKRTLGLAMTPCVMFRGRAPGTYDSLQFRRIGFDRIVFLRHALPERRLWKNPFGLMRAYSRTLWHFYVYFSEAAEDRARRGRRGEALKAIGVAISVFPFRGLFHLIKPGATLQRALFAALALARPAPSAT